MTSHNSKNMVAELAKFVADHHLVDVTFSVKRSEGIGIQATIRNARMCSDRSPEFIAELRKEALAQGWVEGRS